MKHRFSQDARVITKNGQVSPARMAVLEALEAQGDEGATAEEIFALVGNDLPGKRPMGSLGQVLSYMQTDEIVICDKKGRWYLKEHAPQPDLHVNGLNTYAPVQNGSKVQIAPMVQKRSGKTVNVYTSPRTYESVVSIDLLIGNRWIPIPFYDTTRVMIGQQIPDWGSEQWMYTDVETARFMHKDGTKSEEHPAPKDIVTIAQE